MGLLHGNESIFEMFKYGTIKYCNCRDCDKVLLGESMQPMLQRAIVLGKNISMLPEPVAGRINGVPYCDSCLQVHQPPPGRATRDENPPSIDNGVRALEG